VTRRPPIPEPLIGASDRSKRRHRLGLTGAFVVWLIVFAGMVAYLAAH
jgi:hypothetical protein